MTVLVYGLNSGPVEVDTTCIKIFKEEKETILSTINILNKKYFVRTSKDYPNIGFLIRPDILAWSII